MAARVWAVLLLATWLCLHQATATNTSKPWGCKDERGAKYNATFFVIGDWGRQGNANQRRAAQKMADVAGCMRPAFIVSTGDNFYPSGLASATDPQVQESFVGVYNHSTLQKLPWYAVLGNHDYARAIDPATNGCSAPTVAACLAKDCCYSPIWQYTGRLRDARWHCENGSYAVPTGKPDLLDIVMIDSNPFIRGYLKEQWARAAGGLHQQDNSAIKSRMRALLASSKARWKLVVGHHPIASFGEHCKFSMVDDCNDMAWLDKELQDAGVAAYLCGHEHDLQYITKTPPTPGGQPAWPVYVVSGAGSNMRADEIKDYKPRAGYTLTMMSDKNGFVAVRANASHLVLHYYSAEAALPVHTAVLKAR